MNEKEEIIEKYFDDTIKPKDLKKFTQKTPKGNIVSGYLCRKEGKYLSSMVLMEVEVPSKSMVINQARFIRGMPKQHYYDKTYWGLKDEGEFVNHRCLEKMDGTCLMLYTLYDPEHEDLIEIVPRTRGMAVAANHIVDMYNLVDQAQIEEFYSYSYNYDCVLMFELYGVLNKHEILYNKNYIDIKLIGATLEREVLDFKEINKIAYHHCFEMPDTLFELCLYNGAWRIHGVKSRLYPYYWMQEESISKTKYCNLEDCINGVADALEIINNNYKERNGHIATEGVVINGFTSDDKQRYIKIKPKSVFKLAQLGNGIPRKFIKKEVYKYFDEYGIIKIKEIYDSDKTHYKSFVQQNLLEEFPENIVMSKSCSRKIKEVFFDVWESKTPAISIQNICQELSQEYKGEKISDIMRVFAKKYPQYKRKARDVYSILKYIMKEE